MDAATTFHLLVKDGFTLGTEGDKLTVRPVSRLTGELREAIRAHKSELIAMLGNPPPDRPSWRWILTHPDGTVTDHTTTPHATLAEMRAAYPDALSFEPLFGLTPAMEQPRDAA
jgi:hypothetical protein